MAITIAKYKFNDEAAFTAAKERLEVEVPYNYSCGWYYSSSYEILIYDTCEKATLVGQICRALGGKPCE